MPSLRAGPYLDSQSASCSWAIWIFFSAISWLKASVAPVIRFVGARHRRCVLALLQGVSDAQTGAREIAISLPTLINDWPIAVFARKRSSYGAFISLC